MGEFTPVNNLGYLFSINTFLRYVKMEKVKVKLYPQLKTERKAFFSPAFASFNFPCDAKALHFAKEAKLVWWLR